MSSLGLGRSVVRESLATLNALGVVVTRQGRGAFVAKIPTPLIQHRLRRLKRDTEDATQRLHWVWEIREIFEVAIADMAARRRTDTDVDNLEKAVADMRSAVEQGMWGTEQDARFHNHLTLAAKNPLLVQVAEDLSSLIAASRQDSLSRPNRRVTANEEHAAILEAVRKGDARAARRQMRKHLVTGKRLTGSASRED